MRCRRRSIFDRRVRGGHRTFEKVLFKRTVSSFRFTSATGKDGRENFSRNRSVT